jgi:hypothetical protein
MCEWSDFANVKSIMDLVIQNHNFLANAVHQLYLKTREKRGRRGKRCRASTN